MAKTFLTSIRLAQNHDLELAARSKNGTRLMSRTSQVHTQIFSWKWTDDDSISTSSCQILLEPSTTTSKPSSFRSAMLRPNIVRERPRSWACNFEGDLSSTTAFSLRSHGCVQHSSRSPDWSSLLTREYTFTVLTYR